MERDEEKILRNRCRNENEVQGPSVNWLTTLDSRNLSQRYIVRFRESFSVGSSFRLPSLICNLPSAICILTPTHPRFKSWADKRDTDIRAASGLVLSSRFGFLKRSFDQGRVTWPDLLFAVCIPTFQFSIVLPSAICRLPSAFCLLHTHD